jgi:hypothetical protein
MHVSCVLEYRFLGFASSCLKSGNSLVQCLSTYALYNQRSLLGSNFGYIAHKCPLLSRHGLRVSGKAYLSAVRSELSNSFVESVPLWRIGFIKDIMESMHTSCEDNVLVDILSYLCCH